jgi:glycosyltransferase involved in cell wall biosynthesis
MKQISILIPTLPVRIEKYARLIKELNKQIIRENLINQIQILTLTDTKDYLVGKKRNLLISMSLGKYVCFIDDDDMIADDYIKQIYNGTQKNVDCVTFSGNYVSDGISKVFDMSIKHLEDKNLPDKYLRIPNHLSVIKREIAVKCPFPHIQYGEDSEYAITLKKHLKTEHKIDKILYFYHYSSVTSQTNPNSTVNQFQEK